MLLDQFEFEEVAVAELLPVLLLKIEHRVYLLDLALKTAHRTRHLVRPMLTHYRLLGACLHTRFIHPIPQR